MQYLLMRNLAPLALLIVGVPLLGALGAPWWADVMLVVLAVVLFRPTAAQNGDENRKQNSTALAEPIDDQTDANLLIAFLERSQEPILLLSATGRIRFANQAIQKLFPHMQVDQPFASAFRNPILVDAITSSLNDGEPRLVEFESLRLSDRYFEARLTALLEPFSELLTASLMIEVEDRTQARQAEAARRDFIANASHELRTPLAAILGGLETIEMHQDDPEAARTFVPVMRNQAERMGRLIDDLLSLSQIEAQAVIDEDAKVDLAAVAKEMKSVYKARDKALAKRIVNEVDDAPLWANADIDQIHQVLINLVDNALKYGKADGKVRISRAQNDPRYEGMIGITVSDEGAGIAPNHIARLSERFYRVNSDEKTGTGLGLAIVKHILRRHRGALQVQSSRGVGSKFTIWLRPI